MTETTVPEKRRSAQYVAPCPSSDHDGVLVPATQVVLAHRWDGGRVETVRCSYCAEGFVAKLLRDGWVVSTWVTQTPPNDGRSLRDAVQSSVERAHRSDDRGEDVSRLLNATGDGVGVSALEPRVGDVEGVVEIDRDLSHGSPSAGGPGAPTPVTGEASVGAASGVDSFAAPDASTPATVPPPGGGTTAEAGYPQAGPAVTPTADNHGYVVVAVRSGMPVFAEGFSAHADTAEEAARVATAWRGIGEHVHVFELRAVAL